MTAAARRTMPLTFSGGTAVVTGAAAGIGAAIARSLMSAGIRTVRLDVRTPERDKDFDAAVQVCVGADVRDRGVAQLLTAAGAPVDDISYLVNCAGVLDNTGFSGVDRDTWMRCLEINLVGAYNMIDALGPALRGAQAGAVVNITSIEASRIVALTDPDPTPQYAASKAGLLMLTKSAARALAADGVRVNSVSPGFVATAMAAPHGDTSTLSSALSSRIPMGRFAEASEIASAAAFLLSDQAGYITGSELMVDGGFGLS